MYNIGYEIESANIDLIYTLAMAKKSIIVFVWSVLIIKFRTDNAMIRKTIPKSINCGSFSLAWCFKKHRSINRGKKTIEEPTVNNIKSMKIITLVRF